MMKIQIWNIVVIFIIIMSVSNKARCEDLQIKIIHADASEFLLPKDGFFNVQGLHYYKSHSNDNKRTSTTYENWMPSNIDALPTFYSSGDSNGEETRFEAYYLRNRKYIETRKSLIDEYLKNHGSSHSWSMSYKRDLISNSAFNLNIFNANQDHFREDLNINYLIIARYFNYDQEFLNNLVALDLSDSLIHGELFDQIANLPKLEKLVLPINGSPLSHELFKANQNVTDLVVFNTVLTNNILEKISKFKSLKRLVLIGCSADQFFSEMDSNKFLALQQNSWVNFGSGSLPRV